MVYLIPAQYGRRHTVSLQNILSEVSWRIYVGQNVIIDPNVFQLNVVAIWDCLDIHQISQSFPGSHS